MTIAESGIDTSVAHPARRYDYWLGGTDNFAADRASGDEIEKRFPGMRAGVRANRDVLGRMVDFVPGSGAALPPVRELLDALPSGSYLAATHFTTDYMPAEERERYAGMLAAGRSDIRPRERTEFEALFEGLELVEPGVAPATEGRPAGATSTDGVDASRISTLAAVGRKP